MDQQNQAQEPRPYFEWACSDPVPPFTIEQELRSLVGAWLTREGITYRVRSVPGATLDGNKAVWIVLSEQSDEAKARIAKTFSPVEGNVLTFIMIDVPMEWLSYD